jgi:excisionase family DNA binding protein
VPRRQTDVNGSDSNPRSRDAMSWPDLSGPVASRIASPKVEAPSRLLEVADVADYLGMRTDWVYREVRAGRLPHIRLGRAVRFRRESIEAWIETRERGAFARRKP